MPFREQTADFLDRDIDEFHKDFGPALKDATPALKYAQEFLRDFKALDPNPFLSQGQLHALSSSEERLRGFLRKLDRYNPDDPTSSLDMTPLRFTQAANKFLDDLYINFRADFAFIQSRKIADLPARFDNYDKQISDKVAQLEKVKETFKEEISQKNLAASAKIQKEVGQAIRHLAEREKEAISTIASVKATQAWADGYLSYIRDDQDLHGEIKKLEDDKKARFKGLRLRYLRFFKGVIFYGGSSYHNLVKKWRFWRGFWLALLFGLAGAYLWQTWGMDITLSTIPEFFLNKVKLLPLLVLISIAFAFAGRNYRINANILEQYRQRYSVATTLQNLLLLDEIKSDTKLQTKLLAKGTLILFEYQPSGYMGKHDPEVAALNEYVNLFRVGDRVSSK